MSEARAAPDTRQQLRADCSRCQGLCCVAPAFAQSADFAIDKPAGHACPNLSPDERCRIHTGLREHGFPGCAVFDCFGAGQQVVQVTFAGHHWQHSPELASSMFAVFGVLRQLKELLWHLAEAQARLTPGPLLDRVEELRQHTQSLVDAPASDLEQLDAAAHRKRVGPLLDQVSQALRIDAPGGGRDRIGVDLIGANLKGADLRSISMRGAYLLGADLRGADLSRTDLLGADMRAADLRGTLLADSLFLTQPQLDSARGDTATSIPPWLSRPSHWREAGRGLQ